MSTIDSRMEQELYRYGMRERTYKLPDGTWEYEQRPLTMEECLHPEETDHVVASTQHDEICDDIKAIFRTLTQNDPTALVTHDVAVYWDADV